MDAAGQVTTQGNCADVGSQPCLVIDPAGNVTELQLDALGRPVMTVAPNGVSSEEHYDAAGRRDWSKNGLGRKTSYEYDAAGRLAKVTDPVGGATEYGYDARGNRTSVKDANGNVTAFAYDRANRLVTETNPIGKVTAYEYDLAGNRKAKTDANGRTAYQYDANRRLRKVLFADGTSYDYDYDVRGNRTLERSRTHERGLAYDALGRLSEVEDRTLGRKITYGYDAAGNRTRMEVDTGEVVQYRWDALGRLDTVIDPEGEGTRFRYDAAGRRERAEYGNRTTATYGYDAAGQVLSIVYASAAGDVATAFGYAYDAAGNRTYKRFGDGTEERYGYDGLDRLVAVDYPSGRHVDYGYDAVGNRKSLVDSAVTVERWPTSATASAGTTTGVVGAPNSTYWTPPNTTANPHWVELTYAVAERAAGVKVHEWYGSPSVMRVDLIEPDGTSHTAYEGGDRTADKGWLTVKFPVTAYAVKKVRVWTVRTGAASEQIESVGLLAAKTDTYQYNGFNQLLGVTGNDGTSTTFGYDGNGNQVAKTDARGLTEYVYDLDNRLVGIALPTGVSNAFEYDANGLRTRKTDSGGTTAYLLDGMSVIAQYAPGGARQAWYTQSLARIDEVLSVVNGQGKFWYQSDALGSVYALANADGTVRARGGYDVFGAPVAEYGQSVGQPFGFTGREHEADSGLTYHRDRYMQAGFGRWTQPDRLASAARGTDAAAAVASQVPMMAWRWTAAIGREVLDRIPVKNAYAYPWRPTRESDPSGFYGFTSGTLGCEKQNWVGLPLVFVEVAVGPFAVVLFGGLYLGTTTGELIGALAIYGEGGIFDENILKKDLEPLGSGGSKLKLELEAGLGAGYESDLAAADFKGDGWSAEVVVQLFSVIVVGTHSGGAVFWGTHPSAGAGVLVGHSRATYVTSIAK